LSQDHDEGSNVFLQVQLLTNYYSNAYNLYLPEIMLHYYGNRQQNQLHLHLFYTQPNIQFMGIAKHPFTIFWGQIPCPAPSPPSSNGFKAMLSLHLLCLYLMT